MYRKTRYLDRVRSVNQEPVSYCHLVRLEILDLLSICFNLFCNLPERTYSHVVGV